MGLQNVSQILLANIADALDRLEGGGVSDDSIHSARKAVKRARATLRLMRSQLSDEAYRSNNLRLRDAGRALNATRDAKVLLDALDRFRKPNTPVEDPPVERFRRRLVSSRRRVQRGSSAARRGIEQSRDLLRTTVQEIQRLSVGEIDTAQVHDGLRFTYSRARRAMSRARKDPHSERLHEWRKRTQHLWHQLELVESPGSRSIRKFADRAHRLSGHLGNDHDLCLLRDQAERSKSLLTEKKSFARLTRKIERARRTFQRKAFALGRRLYDDKPRKFESFLERCERGSGRRPPLPQQIATSTSGSRH